MIELSEASAAAYLRGMGKISEATPLIQSLSGGIANVVLKVFDPGAGERIGTDLRSPAQIKRGVADTRMAQGLCFVIKQPLAKFKTEAEWVVDIERVKVERDCMGLLGGLLPAGSVPDLLWFDEANFVLAMSVAPTDSVIWKKQLLQGRMSAEAAQHAGMLLAIMHTSTRNDAAISQRYGDSKFFIQQRVDPYIMTLKGKHPDLTGALERVGRSLLDQKHCLIHGDYSPKNIFLVRKAAVDGAVVDPAKPAAFALSHLLLLDFEVAYYGNCAFDIATLINHLLLKAFYHGRNWRAVMIAIDAFWQTYAHTADPQLSETAAATAGQVLGALLLARVDGKSPAEYLTDEGVRGQVRQCGRGILNSGDATLEAALDRAADALEKRCAPVAKESPAG